MIKSKAIFYILIAIEPQSTDSNFIENEEPAAVALNDLNPVNISDLDFLDTGKFESGIKSCHVSVLSVKSAINEMGKKIDQKLSDISVVLGRKKKIDQKCSEISEALEKKVDDSNTIIMEFISASNIGLLEVVKD